MGCVSLRLSGFLFAFSLFLQNLYSNDSPKETLQQVATILNETTVLLQMSVHSFPMELVPIKLVIKLEDDDVEVVVIIRTM